MTTKELIRHTMCSRCQEGRTTSCPWWHIDGDFCDKAFVLISYIDELEKYKATYLEGDKDVSNNDVRT